MLPLKRLLAIYVKEFVQDNEGNVMKLESIDVKTELNS